MPSPNLPAVIQAVESRLPELKKLLPADISADTFLSHFKTAAMQTRNLLEATPRSVVLACVKAANDGLVLDGREAVIVVRNAKRADGSWEKVAVYQRMYTGTLKRVRQALPGSIVESRLVYETDLFNVVYGDEPSIEHKPTFKKDRGQIIAVYAIVTEQNGTKHRDVMEIEEVEAIRDSSQNYDPKKKDSPWVAHFGEMAKKTVLNRLSKLLPQASGRPAIAADADDHNGADDEIGEVFDEGSVAIAPPAEQPAEPAKPAEKPAQAAEPVKQGTEERISETGSITSGKPPFKRSSVPAEEPVTQSEVSSWKLKLRTLRDAIKESISPTAIEVTWTEWDEENAPVPAEVTARAKQLIDARLAEIEAAAAKYREESQ